MRGGAKRYRLGAATLAAVWSLCSGPPPALALAPTRAETSTEQSAVTRTFRECPACPEMVTIPAGTYAMAAKLATDGRPGGEQWPGERGSIGTDHTVQIRRFAFGLHDVTRTEYALFVRESHYRPAPGCYIWRLETWIEDKTKSWREPGFRQSPSDPVVCVNRNDAQAYTAWLNRQSAPANQGGRDEVGPYRLPTWEEMEYAAAGRSTTNYYWGDAPDHSHANYGDRHCVPCTPVREGRDQWVYTSPVGAFPPNAFGLYDMAGDVWQWTDTCWPEVKRRVCWLAAAHGGSWLDNPEYLRTASFRLLEPSNRNTTTGFRVARRAPAGNH